MHNLEVYILDLEFLGNPKAIASFLIPHSAGVVLVESGPGSTWPALQAGLAKYGYRPGDVTDLLLTHIHLDHAGAAGALAKHGARVHVHEIGGPHMADPRRLLGSARRIYREQMDALWGDFFPVPEPQLNFLTDGATVVVEDLVFQVFDTPGHANHHCSFLLEDLCFVGDVGGVRLPGAAHVEIPLPPPETHLERWIASLDRLETLSIQRIATTHFGIHDDTDWHLKNLRNGIDAVNSWLLKTIAGEPDLQTFRNLFYAWVRDLEDKSGIAPERIEVFASVNPREMSADGLYRYWKKHLSV
mgnify:CR=1 FL=1